MPDISDRDYLKNQQYRKPDNLTARINLHACFSTTPVPWMEWSYERIGLQAGCRVLDVGGGPGNLWLENLERLPVNVRIVHSDLSYGMGEQARKGLGLDERFSFINADAQDLPFPADSFERLTANHMLYHVPDLRRTVLELRRVLRSGGRLVAATNGATHLEEMYALMRLAGADVDENPHQKFPFRLEDGAEVLRQAFEHVELERFADSLWVTERQPLVDAIQSFLFRLDPARLPWLDDVIDERIARDGGIHIQKSVGIFTAW
jgi:SAM-dependent methyltransferase